VSSHLVVFSGKQHQQQHTGTTHFLSVVSSSFSPFKNSEGVVVVVVVVVVVEITRSPTPLTTTTTEDDVRA